MDSAMLLDLAGGVVSLFFIAGTVASQVIAGLNGKTTLRRLIKATQVARLAVALAVLNVIIQAIDIPNDGPIWPAVWIFCTATSTATAIYMRRRRDAKGDQVLAEAERTVQSFRKV